MRKLSSILLIAVLDSAGNVFADKAFPMQAELVAADVYAIITPSRELPNPENRGWNSNSAFVVTKAGVLLFDTGSSTAIGESIKKLIAGVTNQPVRWIINSHAHGDHWLGNAVFKDTVEAIYASEQVTKNIANEGQTWVDSFMRMTRGATGQSVIVVPDSLVKERTEIVLGGKRVLLFPSGSSHSPGDILMWLPEENVLVAGDVVYSDRMPSTFDSNLSQWINLLDEIKTMQPKAVIPGHGDVTDLQGVIRLRNLLQAFRKAVEQGYNEGKADYEMLPDVTKALSAYKPHYSGLAEKVKRDISQVYLQIEAASFH